MKMTNEVKYAIDDVLRCETPFEAMSTFERNINVLREVRFIFFDDECGSDIPYYLKNQRIDNFNIYNLASKNKMFVIDEISNKDIIMNGVTNYEIDTCIALDNQAVSYLKNIFTNKPTTVTEQAKYYIKYLLENNINFDYQLYILENTLKLNSQKEKIETYQNILACERFKCLNVEKYLSKGIIEYTKPDIELKMNIDPIFNLMINKSKDKDLKNLWNRYYAIRALILKVSLIKLKYSNKGIRFKMDLLIDFVNLELGCVFERELAISYLFLKKDKRVERFFKKIQPGTKTMINDISGMAWDLFHLRQLEYLMANMAPQRARYELYSIITFDYGLQEVLRVFPIKRCAMYKGVFMPIFEIKLDKYVDEIKDLNVVLAEAKEKRMETFRNANYQGLIKNLEEEIFEFTK